MGAMHFGLGSCALPPFHPFCNPHATPALRCPASCLLAYSPPLVGFLYPGSVCAEDGQADVYGVDGAETVPSVRPVPECLMAGGGFGPGLGLAGCRIGARSMQNCTPRRVQT